MIPKVTIITPTYNHEKYIAKCISSVTNQSFKNWEQIIIDDASSDKTYEIASLFAHKDKRIKIIRHKNNWGLGKLADTYNQALKKSRADLIAILEGDDFWPLGKIQKQLNNFQNPDVVLSFGDCVLTNQNGQPINLFTYQFKKNLLNNNPPGSVLYLFAGLDFSIIPASVIIRKKALFAIGGFKSDVHYPFTDIPTFLYLSLKGKFAYQQDILGFYRKQEASSWFDFAKNTTAMGKEEIQSCVNEFLDRNRRTAVVGKILKNKDLLLSNQKAFIKRKQKMKKLSLWLNNLAFKRTWIDIMPVIFWFRHFLYNFSKVLGSNKR